MKKIIKGLVLIFIIFILFMQIQRAIIYPKNYSRYVKKAAETYMLDEHIIYSIIKCESNFKPSAISNKGAKGLMQILDTTAIDMQNRVNGVLDKTFSIPKDILNPEVNILLGSAYVKMLMQKYQNNFPLMLAAYNAGMGTVDKWIKEGIIDVSKDNFYETIPYSETKSYVIKGIRARNMYDTLYN